MVPLTMLSFRRRRLKGPWGFSLLELMITLAIMGIVAGLAIESGSQSLERARINAVAVDLTGWLIGMRANNANANNTQAAEACYIDFAGASNPTALTTSDTAVDATYRSGEVIFAIRDDTVNGVSGANKLCSNPVRSFLLPDNTTGSYQIRAYSPIVFSVRGTIAISNNSSGSANANDIKIYRPASRLLRCVRIYYSTGTVRIGSNGDAASIASDCTQFNTF